MAKSTMIQRGVDGWGRPTCWPRRYPEGNACVDNVNGYDEAVAIFHGPAGVKSSYEVDQQDFGSKRLGNRKSSIKHDSER